MIARWNFSFFAKNTKRRKIVPIIPRAVAKTPEESGMYRLNIPIVEKIAMADIRHSFEIFEFEFEQCFFSIKIEPFMFF